MARQIVIDNILRLIKAIGGNPSKFMGTKTNINFLGKGPNQALLEGQLDMRVVDAFPREQIVSEAERAGGYMSANKLNDLQLQRLENNLIQLDKVYNPPANITDITTRTGGLSGEGLASLRNKPVSYENPETGETMAIGLGFNQPGEQATMAEAMKLAAAESNAMRKAGLDSSKYGDYLKWQEIKNKFQVHDEDVFKDLDLSKAGIATLTKRIQDRMAKIKKMSDELGAMGKGDVEKLSGKVGTYEMVDPTAEKASYISRFNPKNEIHINKAEALLKDPQIKGVYTEAEVKNASDFEGLYQSHFDKGHVDIARLFEQEGHNIPQMRSAARDALLQLMKKERGVPGMESGLRDFVEQADFKYITEGGGGRAGDPINLMVKYFGKNATENLPKNATKENIDAFTDFIINAKDKQGRGINDPFFDRESIDFSTLTGIVDDIPPFATGGRVDTGGLGEILQVPRTGFKYGSRTIAKGALAFLKKNKKNADYMFKASDNVSPGYAHGDTKYNAELLAEQLAEDAGVVYDDLDHVARSEFYGTAYDYLSNEMAQVLLQKRMLKDIGQKMQLSDFSPKGRKPNASGGLAKILEV